MGGAGVRVDVSAFGRDEDGSYEGLEVAFLPDDSGTDALPSLQTAVARAAQAFGESVGFWGPVPLPGGAAVFSIAWYDRAKDLSELLLGVAEDLTSLGAEGSLHRMRSAGPRHQGARRFQGLVVAISLRLRPDAPERAYRRGRFALDDVAPAVLDTSIERALRWCRIEDGTHYATSSAAAFPLTEEQRADLVARSLNADEVPQLTCERWPDGLRSVSFDAHARMTLQMAAAEWPEDYLSYLAQANDALRLFSDLAEYAFAFRVSEPAVDLGGTFVRNWPTPPMGATSLHWTRALDASRIPDVFVTQLLGPSHPEIASSADEWYTEFKSECRIITSTCPDLWLRENQPDIGALNAAREGFAPLLLTEAEEISQRRKFVGQY